MKSALPSVDSLETRRLMAAAAAPVLAVSTAPWAGGQMLRINGTAGNDTITLSYAGGVYTLKTAAGFTKTLDGVYNAIQIRGAAGNDKITEDASVTLPTSLYGEAGNDTLIGGSGDDLLAGGLGTNGLFGMAGRDTLVSLGGATNDSLAGGDGEDFFWADTNVTELIVGADAFEIKNTVNRVGSFQTSTFTTGTKTQAVTKEINAPRLRDPDLTNKSFVYKSFASSPLFSASGPSVDDVKQGQVGDCYFLSTLGAAANASPETVRDAVSDLGDGTYAVRLKMNGVTKFYRVDNDLAVYSAASTTPAYAGLGADKSVWVAVTEKAWAMARKNQGSYASISAGWMGEVTAALGQTNQKQQWQDGANDAEAYLDWVAARLADGDSVTMGVFADHADTNLVGGHAYTVIAVTTDANGVRQLIVRNPWGVDNYTTQDGANDGYVALTAAQAFAQVNAFVAAKAA